MIKFWCVENFKSVYAEQTLEFAPLTIFAGANSSGKSTLIQSILLTAQTIQNQVHSRSVILNGHIIRLGEFNDILANGAKEKKIKIGFELQPNSSTLESDEYRYSRYFYQREYMQKVTSMKCDFTFGADLDDKQKENQLQPILESAGIEFSALDPNDSIALHFTRRIESLSETLNSLRIPENALNKFNRLSLDYEPTNQIPRGKRARFYQSPNDYKIVGINLRHFIPNFLTISYDSIGVECDKIYDFITELDFANKTDLSEMELNFANSLTKLKDVLTNIFEAHLQEHPPEFQPRKQSAIELLEKIKLDFSIEDFNKVIKLYPSSAARRILVNRVHEKKSEIITILRAGRTPKFELAGIPTPDAINFSTDYIQSYFSESLKYLGPLRDEPKPVYPISANSEPNDVGFKGEHTAAVLELNKNTQIKYIPSSCIPFTKDATHEKTDTLENAVLDWLSYMGIAKQYSTQDKGKLGHELKISTDGSEYLHDLTHVGVGVSQALPILVLSLLAASNSTLIFEQPELHLHPRVQTRLADFFVSLIKMKKQCIVETHSEYIINRLRYLSSESNDKEISENIKMYFVEKNQTGSKYRLVTINENGVIKNWPEGFFDENEKNAADIINSSLKKKRHNKTS